MLPFALLRHFAFAAAGGTETGYTAPGIRARMRRNRRATWRKTHWVAGGKCFIGGGA